MPTDPHHTPIITQPSSSQPQRKQKSRRPKEKDTQVPQSSVPSDPINVADEAVNKEPSMQLKELMDFCTKLQQRVLDLENTKTTQAQEITSLKKRVKKLEKKGGSRTYKLKRLYKGRKIHDIDVDEDITLKNVHDDDMFDVSDLAVNTAAVSTVSIILVSAVIITENEITLAQELVELKSVKPTIAASTRPKAKGLVIHEEEQATTPTIFLQLPSQVKGQGSKDKGKAIKAEKPLKKKDQIKFDEEEALRL
ncbi:hypothetical protein Tco_0489988 [Tanacetum coccineum]